MIGSCEIWTIVNQSGMDHPFHRRLRPALHHDTGMEGSVLVPRMGSVTLLVPVQDFMGMAMFHCHILEHEDIGMMGMWHLM